MLYVYMLNFVEIKSSQFENLVVFGFDYWNGMI